MPFRRQYPDQPLPVWKKRGKETQPQEWARVSFDPGTVFYNEGEYKVQGARVELFVEPVIGRALGLIRRKIWKVTNGDETVDLSSQCTGEDAVEVRKKDSNAELAGAVVYTGNGGHLTRDKVQALFKGFECSELEPGKSYFVKGISKAELTERKLRSDVLKVNGKFPYRIGDNAMEMFTFESIARSFIDEELKIHQIWRDICVLSGNVRPAANVLIEDSTFSMEKGAKQAVGRVFADVIDMDTDYLRSTDEMGFRQFDSLDLPLSEYYLKRSPYARFNQFHTISHEMGHMLTDHGPQELSEGMAELVPTFLALHHPDYQNLPEAFGTGDIQVLFGDLDDVGTMIKWHPEKELYGFHSYQGWAQAKALWDALEGNIENFRALMKASQTLKKIDSRMSSEWWMTTIEKAVPGFSNRLKNSKIFKYQKPGKKIYWCSRNDGWGTLVAFDMDSSLSESKPIDHRYRIVSPTKTLVVDCRGKNYTPIMPETIGEELVLGYEDPGDIAEFYKAPIRVEVQSPESPEEWKQVGEERKIELSALLSIMDERGKLSM